MSCSADLDASLIKYFLALVALLGDSAAIPYDKAQPKPRLFGGKWCIWQDGGWSTKIILNIFIFGRILATGQHYGRGLMASDRLAELLRLSGELSEEEISRMTESAAWQWVHTNASALDKTDNDLHIFENM